MGVFQIGNYLKYPSSYSNTFPLCNHVLFVVYLFEISFGHKADFLQLILELF